MATDWNPNFGEKKRAAQDTWNLYKGSGSGNWMGGENDPYQIRGVQRAGDPNWVDFEYRASNGQGPTTYYGSLSGGAWDNPDADQSWIQGETNNFYNQAGQGMWDAWGNGYGWTNPKDTPYDGGTVNYPDTPLGPQYPYTNPAQPGSMDPEDAVNKGIGTGWNLLEQDMNRENKYPAFWGDSYAKYNAEAWKDQFPSFVGADPYESVDINRTYQGLKGGDYDALQQALTTPGQIAADNAYDRGSRDLGSVMGGRGMYGSSVMGQQANEGLNREYMNAQATNSANAAAQRYGLQQNDLQFGANYGLQATDLARQQNLDKWRTGLSEAGRMSDYNANRFKFDFANSEAARQEQNALLQQQAQWQLGREAWQTDIDNRLFNKSLSLAGQGAPMAQYNQSAAAGENAAKWGLGMNLVGDFLNSDWGHEAVNGAWDWASSAWNK